jgi:nucleoside-triphosphatase THEP1
MTNEELLEDIKQFTTAIVTQAVLQSEERLNTTLKGVDIRLSNVEKRLGSVEKRIGNLEVKVDTIQEAVADAISQLNESTDAILINHEQRLHRLEQRAA